MPDPTLFQRLAKATNRSVKLSLISGVGLGAVVMAVSAGEVFLAQAPTPYAPADAPQSQAAAALDRATRGSAEDRASPLLATGLATLADGRTRAAAAIRDAMPDGQFDRRLLAWSIAMKGGPDVSSTEIARAAIDTADWPGRKALRANSEAALLREGASPQSVVDAFGSTEPETADGAIALARAYRALGSPEKAVRTLRPIWRNERMPTSQETAILAEFGDLIPPADHAFRMERLLHAGRVAAADRVADAAGARDLFSAWSSVIAGRSDASRLLDAIPAARRGPGWHFAKATLLRRAGRSAEAAAIMEAAPRDAAALVDPDDWWTERRALARELIDDGDWKTAYRVASTHAAESPAAAADAEFHAGWIALSGLRDADQARRHFTRIAEIAEGPISRSRAYYWIGRSLELAGDGNAAREAFGVAAGFVTSFYGQVANARLGRTIEVPAAPAPTAEDRLAFERRESVQAIRRLEAGGASSRATLFYTHLADTLDSPGQLALLIGLASERDQTFALRLVKKAVARGIDMGALTHPLGAIPDTAGMEGSDRALAYAVARQESEFNPGAVSGAGARGLLQLLPGTARDMARKSGMPYSADRLVTDAGYNATLGSAFLSDQLARFEGSYVLTLAGYNAGPRRARDWVERYGDPRGKDLDAVIDWIERIPFTETRNYVQRVMENYQVYKTLIAGDFDMARDLTKGR